MGGLTSIHKNEDSELHKEAGEGSLENNLKHLITDEAYSQLSQKFPNIVSLIVGVNIIEKIDDNTTIGGAIVSNGEQKLVIPVIYTNGKVDATTFIYSEENDTMLALTKKIVGYIISSPEAIGGTVYKPSEDGVAFDIGDINKLFIPPKTYSPKIASSDGGLVFAVLEKVASVRDALIKKLEKDDFRTEFDNAYGDGASEHVMSIGLNKVADFKDYSEPKALFSLSDVSTSEWDNKQDASEEFSRNGFVISHGYHAQTKTLEKIASIDSRLREITGDSALESIDLGSPGVYYAYALKDLEPIEVIVADGIGGKSSPRVLSAPFSMSTAGVKEGNPVIGKRVSITESKLLKPFSALPKKNSRVALVFMSGNEIFGSEIMYLEDETIERGLGSTIIRKSFGYPITTFNIEKNSDASPVVLGSTIYVGDNNVRVVDMGPSKERKSPVRMRDLDAAHNGNGDIVKVAFDGAEYFYNHNVYSRKTIVNELLGEGYDKSSIYALMKTAGENGSAEFAALSAKLDILGTIVTNLAGKIQVQQDSLDQINMAADQATAVEQSVTPSQAMPAQEQAAIPAPQAPQNGTMMPDPNSGIPTQEQAAQQQASQQQTVAADQQMLGQNPPIPGSEALPPQGAPTEQEQPGLVDGMNTALDPQILATLAELKNSQAMDAGVVSMLANSEAIGDIVQDYRGDILNGASAIGRILLNLMTKKNDMIKDLGDKKYNQIVKTLRVIFVKTSDLYVDIVKMELESNGKMAN